MTGHQDQNATTTGQLALVGIHPVTHQCVIAGEETPDTRREISAHSCVPYVVSQHLARSLFGEVLSAKQVAQMAMEPGL